MVTGIGADVYVTIAGEALFIALLIGWAVTKNRRQEPKGYDG